MTIVLGSSNPTPNLISRKIDEAILEIQEFLALKFKKPLTILISTISFKSESKLFAISVAISFGDFLKILEKA